LYTVAKIFVLKNRKILIQYKANFTPENSMKVQRVLEVQSRKGPGFVGTEAYTILGVLFKKNSAKLRLKI